jgi:hypothetical protein
MTMSAPDDDADLRLTALPDPGVSAAGVMYDAGVSHLVILKRLQDPEMMRLLGEPRAFTEAEAIAAYGAVAVEPLPD